jgi:Fe2+ or Zn2+ uptake regulation protein
MKRYEKLVQAFKEHGYKMTPQRRAILEAIAGSLSHPTAEQIHEVVRERMPDTSLATVYNTLRELVSIEEARELDLGDGVRRYEVSLHEHAHAVCINCGRVQDIEGDFGKLRSLFPRRNGFTPVRYAMTIYGYCPRCAGLPDES